MPTVDKWLTWASIAVTCFVGSAGLFAIPESHPSVIVLAVLFLVLGIISSILAIKAWRAKPPVPHVILHPERSFYVKRVPWGFFEIEVLNLRLANRPKVSAESAIAKGLGVRFTVKGENLRPLPWLDARIDDSPQPNQLPPGQWPPIIFDLGIGKDKEVNLIVKELQSDGCYLFNNDSWHFLDTHRAQNPEWKIGPGRHRVLVKVCGVEVHEEFVCFFRNDGQGGSLVVEESRPLEQP